MATGSCPPERSPPPPFREGALVGHMALLLTQTPKGYSLPPYPARALKALGASVPL